MLVFLDGQENIESLRALVLDKCKTMPDRPLVVLPLYALATIAHFVCLTCTCRINRYAALPQRYQMRVFAPAKHRKGMLVTL